MEKANFPVNSVPKEFFQVCKTALETSNIWVGPIATKNQGVFVPAFRFEESKDSNCQADTMTRKRNYMPKINTLWLFDHDVLILDFPLVGNFSILSFNFYHCGYLFPVKVDSTNRARADFFFLLCSNLFSLPSSVFAQL